MSQFNLRRFWAGVGAVTCWVIAMPAIGKAPVSPAGALDQDVATARRVGDWAPVYLDLQSLFERTGDPIYLTAKAAMQFQGLGGSVNPAQVAAGIRLAADKREPLAMTHLGVLYARGYGVPQDLAQAAAWHRRAADMGVSEAQYNLGQLLHVSGVGDGQGPDAAQAAVWYRKAADQGFGLAKVNLAALLWAGQGVAKNEDLALQLFREAADAGETAAQTNLGSLSLTSTQHRHLGHAYYYLTLATQPEARGPCLPAALWVAVRRAQGAAASASDAPINQELARQSCMSPNPQAQALLGKLDALAAQYPELAAIQSQTKTNVATFLARRQKMDEAGQATGSSGSSEVGLFKGPAGWSAVRTGAEAPQVAVSELRPEGQAGEDWRETATFKRFANKRYTKPGEHLQPILALLAQRCAQGWMPHQIFEGEENGLATQVMATYCDETLAHGSESHYFKVTQGREAFYEWHATHRGEPGDGRLHPEAFKQQSVAFAVWLKNQGVCQTGAAAGALAACPSAVSDANAVQR